MSTTDSTVGMKTCFNCAVEKSFDEFHKNKARKDGIETYCRDCNNAKFRAKYANNREKEIARTRKYHQEHLEWSKATLRKWHVENRDYRLQKIKDRLSTDPEFVAYRREVQNRSERERRARIANVTVEKITKENYKNILASYNNCCWICELPLNKVVWDHVHPVSKGGPHTVENLRPACSSCNVRKNSKWPFTEEMRKEVANEVRLISSRGGDA